MKRWKQEKILALLQKKYKADTEAGRVYSYRNESWSALKGSVVNGYRQISLFAGDGSSMDVYEHVVIYLAAHGTYEQGSAIKHKDDNMLNNKWWNLELIAPKVRRPFTMPTGIRDAQIKKIRDLIAAGETNYTRMAEAVLRDRVSVMRIAKRIQNGQELRFEGDDGSVERMSDKSMIKKFVSSPVPKGDKTLNK
jgi:hypothetical protein